MNEAVEFTRTGGRHEWIARELAIAQRYAIRAKRIFQNVRWHDSRYSAQQVEEKEDDGD
jgi:hypothetical protein